MPRFSHGIDSGYCDRCSSSRKRVDGPGRIIWVRVGRPDVGPDYFELCPRHARQVAKELIAAADEAEKLDQIESDIIRPERKETL